MLVETFETVDRLLSEAENRTAPTLLIPADPVIGPTRDSIDQPLARVGER
jgi:hypothetical protein